MSNRTKPANVDMSEYTDTVNLKASSGHAIQIHADNAIWDTVSNKFLSVDNDVVRKK